MTIDKTKGFWLAGGLILVLLAITSRLSPSPVPLLDSSDTSSMAYDTYGYEAAMPQTMTADRAEKSMGIVAPNPSPELLTDSGTITEQKIIKNGSLDLDVDNIDEAVTEITHLVDAAKGSVNQASIGQYGDERRYGNLTLRVPASAFSSVMDQLKKVAVLVNNESISSNDVTEQYIDLSARLNNAKAQERAYLDVLTRATNVPDILSVQQALSQVRSEIESLQGRVQYLDNQAELSTISVSLSEESSVGIPSKTFRPWSTVKDAVNDLVGIVQDSVDGLIRIIIVGGGILIPLGLVALGIHFFWKRRK